MPILYKIFQKTDLTVKDRMLLRRLDVQYEEGCTVLSSLSSMVLEYLASAIRQEKEIQGIHMGKKK